LSQFFQIVAHNGEKKLLIKIFYDVVVKLDVMKSERFSNRVINQREVLKNESIPASFLAPWAAGKQRFFM